MYTHHIIMLTLSMLRIRSLVREAITIELNQHWRECLEAFLRSFSPSDSEASVRNYRSTLSIFFRGLQRDPAHATRADVERYIWMPVAKDRRRSGERPTPGTRNMRLSVIASFYKFASSYVPDGQYESLFVGRLPTTGITRYKRDVQYKGMSVEDTRRFFSVIPRDTLIGKRDFAYFLMLYATSRRLREIADLKMGDITYETIVNGKTRRQAFVYKFRNKGNKGRVDSAELSEYCKLAIDDYLEASGRLPLSPDDPLFVHSVARVDYDPYAPLASTSIHHRFKLYCQYANLDSLRLSPHSLRHASASHRLSEGISILELQHLLRHASLETTRIYVQGLITEADPGQASLIEKLDL